MKKSSKDDIGKTFDVEFENIFNYLWREMVIVLFIKKNIDTEKQHTLATSDYPDIQRVIKI